VVSAVESHDVPRGGPPTHVHYGEDETFQVDTDYFCSRFDLYLKAKGSKQRALIRHNADRRSPVDEMPGGNISFDAVRSVVLPLAEVEEGTLHGAPAFRVRGKLLACAAIHRSAEPDTLAVRIPFDLRAELLESDPHTYYLTDHYENHPAVLVRLSRIKLAALRELLGASWRFVTAKRPKIKSIVRLLVFVLFACAAGHVGAAQNKLESSDWLTEPAYKGQPLSHWVEILSGGGYSSKFWPDISEIAGGAEAQEALEHIGPEAVPFLLKQIPDRGAMVAFRVLGPAARSAIPQLVAMATNELAAASTSERPARGLPAIGWAPLTVLGWIGPDALPELSMFLTNYHEPGLRFGTLQAIGTMGAKAVPAVPALLPCVNDENEMVAREAIGVLGRLGGGQQPVFEALTNLLQGRPALRGETLEALVSFGDEAFPVILKGLQGANLGTHYIVGNTFIRASPEVLTNAALLTMLAAELQSPDPEARDWAALMLRAADGQSRFAKPQHLADLAEVHGNLSQIRNEATNTLQRLAPQLLRNGPP
jgi:hypothetical protein